MDMEKELLKRLEYLKKYHPQYNVVFIAHQGSYNYGLEINDEDYQSDFDVKAFIIPSFDDLYENKFVSDLIIYEDGSHIDIKDIRHGFDLILKGNIQYIELLFAKYQLCCNDDLKDIIETYKNKIVANNILKISKCFLGMAKEKRVALCHRYEGLKEKIDKYGYDGKQLHHIIRLYYTLQELYKNDFLNYGETLQNFTEEEHEILDEAKKNVFSKEFAIFIADSMLGKIEKLYNKIEEKYFDTSISRAYFEKVIKVRLYQLVKREFKGEIH